jgi:RNA polymerase sigma factor (sigma-70 family)
MKRPLPSSCAGTIDLVYAAALRRLNGDAHGAADVAQKAFTALARSAARVAREAHVAPWLYGVTRNIAVDHVRAERRRRVHEQAAELMSDDYATDAAADWTRLQPLLDAAMDALGERDRTAVVLRYFSRQPFAEVGRALGVSEDAARMRVERALNKLHARLARRGITSTSAALAVALTNEAVVAAPGGIAAQVAQAALASAAGGGATAAVAFVQFMSNTKLALSLAGLLAVLAVGTATRATLTWQSAADALAVARRDYEALIAQERGLQQRVAVLEQDKNEAQRSLEAARGPKEVPASSPAPASGSEKPSPAWDTVAAGAAFLARHPEVKQVLDDYAKARMRFEYGSACDALGLSETQRERYFALRARDIGMGAAGPDGPYGQKQITMLAGGGSIEAENGPGVLDLETLRKLREAEPTAKARDAAAAIVGALWFTETPLTVEQSDELVRAITEAQDQGRMHSVDWGAVVEKAGSFLSPTQLAVVADMNAREQYRRAINRPVAAAVPAARKTSR